jgi:NADH dehydrogenase
MGGPPRRRKRNACESWRGGGAGGILLAMIRFADVGLRYATPAVAGQPGPGPEVLRDIAGLETNRLNQLVVTPTLQTTRDLDIFALGDCAACPRGGGAWVPPRAQAAHQQASLMVEQIDRRLAGRPMAEFTYRDFGSLVSLGRYSTVGSLMGFLVGKSMFIEGYFARLMYRSLYKMHQTALHGRAPVLWRTLAGLLSSRAETGVKLH